MKYKINRMSWVGVDWAKPEFSLAEYQLMEALVVIRRSEHTTCDGEVDCELCCSVRGLTRRINTKRFYKVLEKTRRMN